MYSNRIVNIRVFEKAIHFINDDLKKWLHGKQKIDFNK